MCCQIQVEVQRTMADQVQRSWRFCISRRPGHPSADVPDGCVAVDARVLAGL